MSSNVHSPFEEAVDSYRRSLLFENELMADCFLKRYDFKTEEHMRKMVSHGIPLPTVWRYKDRRTVRKTAKALAYRNRLEKAVEVRVNRYYSNFRIAFKLDTK